MMSTSGDPEKPSKRAKSGSSKGSAKGYRTSVRRRLKYMLQDAGYAAKKAGRRIADPVRDAQPKRPKRTGSPKASKPAGSRGRARPSTSGARELGERPVEPKRPTARGRREAPRRRRVAPKRKSRAGRKRAREKRRLRIPRPSGARVAAAITGFGERASRLILGALAPLGPPLLGLVALGRRGLAALAAILTPLRAALIATALAAILLGVSQFVDYRGVAVGVPDYAAYADAEVVAPAPQVDRETAGSAHAYLLLPVALLALALLYLCARGRWQLGRIVALLGIFAIAVSLIVDVPAGLDESVQAVAYEGAEARLIEGFYVQLTSAAVIVIGGLLVSHYARREGRRAPRRKRRAAAVGRAQAGAA